MRARYYGKRIRKWVYKTFKSRASMLRARRALYKKRGIILMPTMSRYWRKRINRKYYGRRR